jgi:hypothetical protein
MAQENEPGWVSGDACEDDNAGEEWLGKANVCEGYTVMEEKGCLVLGWKSNISPSSQLLPGNAAIFDETRHSLCSYIRDFDKI